MTDNVHEGGRLAPAQREEFIPDRKRDCRVDPEPVPSEKKETPRNDKLVKLN